MRLRSAAALAAALVAYPALAEGYEPRNECLKIPGYADFERKFVTAVVNRNDDMIVALASPEILLDFGGGSGREEFRRRLSDPYYNLWEELAALLPLGCGTRDGIEVSLPWYWTRDFGDRDLYATSLVMGTQVPLYESATGSKTVAILDWAAVERAAFYEAKDEETGRKEVILSDGRRGYVEENVLRSLIDFRLLAGPDEDGAWSISYFNAGD